MKAVFLNLEAGPESLVVDNLPQPRPGNGEVLVKIHAAAVTPSEFQWFPTFRTQDGKPRAFPIVLGHEFSGVVAGVGEGVNDWKMGDAVFGMNDWFANGAQAEFCIAPAASLAPNPGALTDAQASVVPISALTAWQGLLARAQLKAGERVLIHGASGGVGVFAVQLARWRGARVVATASARNLEFVHDLGADEAIDYKAVHFEKVVGDVDVVFDTIGGETLERSWSVLKPGGRMVTIASQSEGSKDERVRAAFFIVEPSREQLTEIGRLLNTGRLRAFVEKVFPLAQARDAYAHARQSGHRGKAVLEIGE